MKRIILTLMTMAAVFSTMSAYDFLIDGVYYNRLSDTTVAVTYRSQWFGSYSGDIIVPEKVMNEGVEYTVTQVGDFAFYGSYSLTSVDLPNTITRLGTSSFLRCRSLTSFEIPNSVTRICTSAFSECDGLTSIFIPSSVTYFEGNSFHMCPGLESITVAEDNPKYDSRENCNAVIETETNRMIIGCRNTVVPSSVTSFGAWVFAGTTGFTSFVVPEGTKTIPNYMLAWCENLTSVEIPNTVTSIGYDAFRGCSSLTHLELPNSLTYIDIGAFSEMPMLESIHIPSNVYHIGEGFQMSSGGLVSLSVAIDNQYYDSREDCNAVIRTYDNVLIGGCQNTTVPSTVTTLGAYAFTGCIGLTSFDIPNTIDSIGSGVFFACSNLTRVTLPDSIRYIKNEMFYECSSLKEVTIPELVSNIGDNAFRLCYGLTKVVCLPKTPPTMTNYTFYESYNKATVFVPFESLEAYKNHELWGKFTHIVPFIGAGPGDVNGDGSISVGDATDLIDQLLSGGDLPEWMDVNGDGHVSIGDVTNLIDMLLGGN